MALIQANIYSNVLQTEMSLDVILPQRTEKLIGTNTAGNTTDVPVLYLLHGMGGNHSVWQRRTSIERYAGKYGIAVVMPSTELGWYTDTTYGANYWTYIADELPKICHELFPQLSTKREKTFAAGASMGGYGALKLGLKRPENFAAVASLSGAVILGKNLQEMAAAGHMETYLTGIFGPLEQLENTDNEPLQVLEKLAASGDEIPRIYMVCGEQDFLYAMNVEMSEHMTELGVPHTFESGAGEHSWGFWDQWIQRVLEWMFGK